ncbi:hypothetical protein, partial [Burkholderia stabilis]|uniref:hypothetical protein n=1 Tax=Burkholderia stabilis TaxID=95485 RepID=UPI001F4A9863
PNHGRRRRDRRAALTAPAAPPSRSRTAVRLFSFLEWNRSRAAFYPNGERRNKLLLYGHKSGTYYAPVFSLNLINSRYENIPFRLVNRSFRFC